MGFTQDQEEGYKFITALLKSNEYNVATLVGSAGTGKSYLITRWLEDNQNIRVVFLAPTHKARNVLEQFIASTNIDRKPEVTTVASFLNLKPFYNNKTGEQLFKPTAKTGKVNISGNHLLYKDIEDVYDLVIADECSMLTIQHCTLLQKHCPKLLYVGDSFQLPSIENENEYDAEVLHLQGTNSIAFNVKPTFELKEIVRYSGEILDFANNLKFAIHGNRGNILDYSQYATDVLVLPKRLWKQTALEHFKEANKQQTNQVKCLAFRNKVVDKLNMFFRDSLYSSAAINSYLSGETVVVKKPIKIDEFTILQTSQELFISDAMVAKQDNLLWYFLDVVADNGISAEIKVIHEESTKDFDKRLKELRNEALRTDIHERRPLWTKFYELKEQSAELQHIYALTVDKSQGSTYDTVFVDINDILNCPDWVTRLKRTYTAVTRTKNKLYLAK